jgi:hypothetical protein
VLSGACELLILLAINGSGARTGLADHEEFDDGYRQSSVAAQLIVESTDL